MHYEMVLVDVHDYTSMETFSRIHTQTARRQAYTLDMTRIFS